MPERRSWPLPPIFLCSLGLIFTIVWFVMLGARTLVPTDEGRYAEMAREMLATGDWITTRLNGIKYFEKPPLQIWMTALAFKFFGLGEWQARLWTGLCGFIGILLTGIASARVFGDRTGLVAMLVLASCLFWDAMGHINTLDMGLAGGMTLTLCSMLIAQGAAEQAFSRLRWMLACWVGMALAVLSKGLIGVALPGAVLVIYTLVSRDWAIWKRLHLLPGLLLFAVITVPWFVLVSVRNPEFPHFFFIHEHFQRFTSKVHHREGPWYYFVPILVGGLLPWLAVTPQSIWAARHENRGLPAARATGAAVVGPVSVLAGRPGKGHPAAAPTFGFQPKKLLAVWASLIFIFFSISSSKLPSYILPIFPALALLAAGYLRTAPQRAWWLLSVSMALLGLAMLAAVPRMPHFAKGAADLANYRAAQPWVVGAALTLLAGALAVLWWCWRERAESARRAVAIAGSEALSQEAAFKASAEALALRATLALSIAGFVAVQCLMLGAEAHGRTRSGIALVPATAAQLGPDTPLYAVGLYDQTLPFYLRRTMILVAHADELEFGLEQEPALWLPTIAAFIARWKDGPKAVAVTRPEIFARLQAQGVHMRVITQDERRVVITNR